MRRTAALLILFAGCDDNVWGELENAGVEPPAQQGYAGVIEIAEAQCLGCHNASGVQGGLDMETDLAAGTVAVIGSYGLPIVSPTEPENSMFFLKITNTQPENTGTDMPPGSGGLPPALTDVVEAWILDGAPAQ